MTLRPPTQLKIANGGRLCYNTIVHNKKSRTEYRVLQIKSREHRPCFFSIDNVRQMLYNCKQKGGDNMKKNEINKITKIDEMEAKIKTEDNQEITISWSDIINLIQIMIYEEPGYEVNFID